MVSKKRRAGSVVLSSFCALSLIGQTQIAFAAAQPSDSGAPAGTLLIPLTPKLDTSKPAPQTADEDAPLETPASVNSKASAKPGKTIVESAEIATDATPSDNDAQTQGESSDQVSSKSKSKKPKSAGQLALEQADKGGLEEETGDSTDDTTLKGTVQIVADDTEYDQAQNCFVGTGNAVALISGQNSKLEADSIVYNQSSQIMDARGNVKIYRNGDLSTGSSFKFNVTSGEYLITDVETGTNGNVVVARRGLGTNNGLVFKNGELTMRSPVYLYRATAFAPKSYAEQIQDKNSHPDAYMPSKPSFRFKANKMVYEKYNQDGNLTVFGGRIETGNFSVPIGKFVMNAGNDNPVTFPVMPFMGNNLQTGGISFGPRFSTAMPNGGVFSWAPLLQLGGQTLDSVAKSTKSFGLGDQISYNYHNLQVQQGFGSTTGLFVASVKYKIYKKIKFQSGINRYLDDGMFGTRRAKYNIEVYDNHSISAVPFFSNVNFRTSAGWSQDNPQLLNQGTSQYKALFGSAANTTVQNRAFKFQEQLTATTHPLFRLGDTKYGMKSYIYSGAAVRAYSTGQSGIIGQIGPVFDVYADRIRAQVGYTQAGVRGSSPFVYDQYIQGTQSAYISGDYRFSKYVTLGGTYGYNFQDKLAYQKAFNIAIGPPDFKVIGMYNQLTSSGRVGFDVLYGQPIQFNQLLLKNKADQGVLGSI